MKKLCKKIFNEINESVFEKKLDKSFFVLESKPRYKVLASICHDYENFYIFINTCNRLDKTFLFHLIAHEMCHQANYSLDKLAWSKCTHGKMFKKQCKKIAKIYCLDWTNIYNPSKLLLW